MQASSAASGRVDELEDGEALRELSVTIPHMDCSKPEPHESVGLLSTAADVHGVSARRDAHANKAASHTTPETDRTLSTWPPADPATTTTSCCNDACTPKDPTSLPSDAPTPKVADRFEVVLERASRDTSFGMQVAAYSGFIDTKPFNGIYVKSIVPDSPAALTTQMCVNDRIVAVNSIDITTLSNEEAISLLRQQLREDLISMLVLERRTCSVLDSIQTNSNDEVVQSTVRDGETITQAVCDVGHTHQEASDNIEGEAKQNAAPLCRFEKDDSTEKEQLELQLDGKIHPDVVKALQLTWADILGYDVDIVVVQFSVQPIRSPTDNAMQHNALGLSLDVNTNNLVRYFVSNVDCDGPSAGKLQCGDEVLEINGRKVRQLPEEELINLLYALGDDVRVVAARSLPERTQCTDLQQQTDVTVTVNKNALVTQQQAMEQVSTPTNCLVNSLCQDAAVRQQRNFSRILRSKSETNLSLHTWSANTTNQCSPKRLPSIQKAVRRLQAKSTSPRARRAATHSRKHRRKDTDRTTSLQKPVTTVSKQNTRMLPLEVLMKDYNIQPLIGLAIWTREPVIIDLFKSSNSGLGFSVAEYRDPFNPIKPIIVVRSLVPRGVADADGRLLPGDRLLFVNETQVDSCTLDEALRVLRNLPSGVVRLGVAKPLPITNQDALVDMTAPCEGMQDGAFQQYASLLANPVAGATGNAMRRKPKRRDTSRKAAAREGGKFKDCDQSQTTTMQRLPVTDVLLDNSSVALQRPASPDSALQRDVPEGGQQYGVIGSRSVPARTNGTDDAVDNISESRISSVSIGFGGMTSMCSDSDMTLSDVCRPDYRKLQCSGKSQPPDAELGASQDRDCPSINGDQSDWKNEPAWSPPLGQQPPSLSASASASNSDSVQGRSRCDEFASPTQQSETVVLIDAADSSVASPHSQSLSRKWPDPDPDPSIDPPVSNVSGRSAKQHSRTSVSTTFTSTETDTADESNAFRVRRPRTPTPNGSHERLPSRNTRTRTRRLMRAATCDYHDVPPQCQHLAHCSQVQIRRQRIHNSEDTLNVNKRRQRAANSSPQRNMKQLVPGTVVTTSIFKSELGLGFSVCKRIVNALPCGGACTAMSPNHSGESTPRPTTIYVKDIASRSPAWNDGTLEPGDQILKINRFDVSSVGYKEALRLLRSTVGEVEITVLKQPLKIADRPNLLSLSGDQIHFSPADPSENNFESMPDAPPPWYVGNVEYDPRSIELRDGQKTWIWLEKSEAAANSGIGLSIAALARRGALQDQLSLTDSIVITAIQPNSVSALDGRLRLGDRILQIDECELSGIPAESAIRILKEKSRNSKEVYLYVERYARHSVVHADNSTHCRFATEIFEVEIWKPQNGGIGILISGTGENGILVTGIVPRSVAESNGLICVGDVMLELNGIDVTRFRQEEVATLLKNAQGLLTFKFKRTVTIAQSSLRSHSGSVASIAASTKALRETEPSTATNTHSSIAVSPQCSSDELHVDVHRPVNFANMHKSPSSGSFYKHVYAKRKQKAMQKRARSASPKRTHPFGHVPRDRKRSEDEACESESTCLWQTILTPLNRIKYSIFPSFTAKSTDDTSLSNNADEDRCIENEYSLSDVFVMRDRNGQLGFGVTGGKMDDSSYWLEELAVLHLNKMASLPVVVTRIVKEGPADRSRQIEVGDRIVLINNQSVDGLAHEQVVQRLRGPPQTPIHFRLERAHEKSRLMRLWPNKSKKSQPRRPGVCKVTFERTMSKGLGFCIMGGYDEISGRFVPFVIKAVFPQSPAAKYGLRPGDQLLSVNGSSLENELHETAVTLLKNPKDGKTTLLLLTV